MTYTGNHGQHQGYGPYPGHARPGGVQGQPMAPYAQPAGPPPQAWRRPPSAGASVFVMGAWLALLWAIEVVDTLLGGALDAFGITPREITDLPSILVAPLLHFGFGHLMANSLPFLVLGTLARMAGRLAFGVATAASVVVSGLAAWLLSAPNTVTIGASGLVFGWLTFLLVRGLFAGNWVQIIVAAAVFGFFGGMLWGVFPAAAGVSWQAHLGGALGGVAAAWWLGRRRPAA